MFATKGILRIGIITSKTPPNSTGRRYFVTKSTKIPLRSWLNPWADLALLIPPKDLADRVFAYTQLWGLLSTLMCTASVTTLLGFPHCKGEEHPETVEKGMKQPLLAMLVPYHQLHDYYIGACVCSFFVGGVALGMSTVGSCTGFLIPVESVKWFVVRHSLMLGSLPFLTVFSGGLLGISVVIGVDIEDRGGPLSYLALGGYTASALLIGTVSLSGHASLVRSIAASSRKNLYKGWTTEKRTLQSQNTGSPARGWNLYFWNGRTGKEEVPEQRRTSIHYQTHSRAETHINPLSNVVKSNSEPRHLPRWCVE